MSNLGSYVIAAATTAGVLAGAYCVYYLYNEPKASKLPTIWKKVGTLDDIYMYPIKSCAGIQKTTAECTTLGLKDGWLRDRTLMVVDDKYRTVTARVFPKLLLVKPAITHSTLKLKCKDMEPLHLNLEEASIINTPGMFFCSDTYVMLCLTQLYLRYADNCCTIVTRGKYEECKVSGIRLWMGITGVVFQILEQLCNRLRIGTITIGKDTTKKILKFQKTNTVAFVDDLPFNLLNQASIDDLNTRLKGVQVNHKHFRTNFLLSGAQPYDEDNWKFIKIGENIFEVIRPCSSYRQETDPEMRRVAGSAPRMGLQMILRSNNGGIVSVNDAIYVA